MIPIRNVYYLLCYAWDWLQARTLTDVGSLEGNRVENLLGRVLADGVAQLIRRGLDRGYVSSGEEGSAVRGKLLLSTTVKRALLARGQVAFAADDLSYDVVHNRAIKAAMRELSSVAGLDECIRGQLLRGLRRLEVVADVPLTTDLFRRIQLNGNNSAYIFLIHVCELVTNCFVPDPQTGTRRFYAFTASNQIMGHLFESFVRNFLAHEQSHFRVSHPKITWATSPSPDLSWLPEMQTDAVLTSANRRIVIEAKFYARPFVSRWGEPKLPSSNLYQLLSYLTHLRQTTGPAPEGLLLYAGSNLPRPLDYEIAGHRVRVRALNLSQDWPAIHEDLLVLAAE